MGKVDTVSLKKSLENETFRDKVASLVDMVVNNQMWNKHVQALAREPELQPQIQELLNLHTAEPVVDPVDLKTNEEANNDLVSKGGRNRRTKKTNYYRKRRGTRRRGTRHRRSSRRRRSRRN